ncbi:MAG: response regulator [Mariprofundaceae bacterium]
MATFHIIEDEEHLRRTLKSMISIFGYQSDYFDSADAYIKHMKSTSYRAPSAILTDNMMPGTSGYELIKVVREVNPHQKIVMITGTPDRIHSSSDELCFTLKKPFRMVHFKELLTALVSCCEDGDRSKFEKQCKYGLKHCCPREEK